MIECVGCNKNCNLGISMPKFCTTVSRFTRIPVDPNNILCCSSAPNEKILLCFDSKALSIFGGYECAVVDADGNFYLIDTNNPHEKPVKFTVPTPAIEIACLINTYFIIKWKSLANCQ